MNIKVNKEAFNKHIFVLDYTLPGINICYLTMLKTTFFKNFF